MVNNPIFRELLIYIGGGMCTEEDIPHRTKFTNEIIEAWKRERKVFADDMKVSWVMWRTIRCDPHELIFHDSVPLGEFHLQQMPGVLQILRLFLG